MPVAVMPMPLMGATAPGSLVSTVLLANCETLGTLCLVQAADPGVPFIYAPVIATMDPRSGRYASGAVEHYVLSAAGTQMARHYGLPVRGLAAAAPTTSCPASSRPTRRRQRSAVTSPGRTSSSAPAMLAGATVSQLEQLVMDVEVFRTGAPGAPRASR